MALLIRSNLVFSYKNSILLIIYNEDPDKSHKSVVCLIKLQLPSKFPYQLPDIFIDMNDECGCFLMPCCSQFYFYFEEVAISNLITFSFLLRSRTNVWASFKNTLVSKLKCSKPLLPHGQIGISSMDPGP